MATMMPEELRRADPPSLDDVPWDALQQYRCRAADETYDDECIEHPNHRYTIGGRAYYVPADVLAAYAAARVME